MQGPQITVIGECVADALLESSTAPTGELALRVLPGGGPANTAVALGGWAQRSASSAGCPTTPSAACSGRG